MPFKNPEQRKLDQHKYHEEHKQEINNRHREKRHTHQNTKSKENYT